MSQQIVGAVLAGGHSRRMGRDKALLPFRGRTLIQRATGVLREALGEVFVVAHRAVGYEFLGLPEYSDLWPGRGPLGGVHTALNHSSGRPVFVLACDLPFVVPELVRHLVERASRDLAEPSARARVWIPRVEGLRQPLCGVYSQECLPAINRRLRSGQLKVSEFLEEIEVADIAVDSKQDFFRPDLLANLNRPEDLNWALEQPPIRRTPLVPRRERPFS